MSQPELVKAYGGFRPADQEFYEALAAALLQAMPAENAFVELRGKMCVLSFEGVYFPLEEVLKAIGLHARSNTRGRLDYLDLENWRLVRHELAEGEIASHEADLNHVLDYSGF